MRDYMALRPKLFIMKSSTKIFLKFADPNRNKWNIKGSSQIYISQCDTLVFEKLEADIP